MFYVAIYLGAIVLANLLITAFGPDAVIPVAFLLIGLDLTARDQLHEAWRNDNLVLKMGALIAVGSILSWLLNRNAGPVAVASFVAFAATATVDALVYHRLGRAAKEIPPMPLPGDLAWFGQHPNWRPPRKLCSSLSHQR